MNDLTFSSYENYCSSSHQVTDVNSIIQNLDQDETQPTFHYLSNVSCDITSLSQINSVDQRHQQGSLYNFIPNTNEEQTQIHDGHCTSNRVCAGVGLSNVGNSGNVYGTIPFVQIHTTNVQRQRTSYGNVFRRNISKQEEIKSEPIKSENTEAAKERTNATPTPPRTNNQTPNENSMEHLALNDKASDNTNNNNVEEKSNSLLQIYKCSKCPFISLNQADRDNHGINICSENQQRQSFNCPGCSNIFFNQKSLGVHLKFDHLMIEDDVMKLINTLIESIPSLRTTEKIRNTSIEPANKTNDATESNEPIRKSRIYLKNVECLREPSRQTIEQTENQLSDTNNGHSVESKKSNPAKQKISIKSVDVLREPALLRRNYEIQSPDLNNYINFNTDLLNNQLNLTTTNSYDFTPNSENTVDNPTLNSNANVIINSSQSLDDTEITQKSRRPKIYVKSVESFNLMPIESLQSANNTAYISNQNNSNANSQVSDANIVHMPYLFDSNSNVTNFKSNSSFINNHDEIDNFPFINTTNSTTNFTMDSSLYLGNSVELGENCEQMVNVTLIPDSATPTPPAAVDIITIMDKPAVTIQEQRGTLHLRTVDELNLMNKTEVQHLIAPNLDNNHSGDVLYKVNSSSLNDINLLGDDLYEDDHFKFHDLNTQMVNDWPETYEDLAEDINCIIAHASNENSTENDSSIGVVNQKMNSSNFDIDTPQVSLITIRDIEELTGTANHTIIHDIGDQQDSVVEQIQDCPNSAPAEIEITNQEPIMQSHNYQDNNVSDSNLKRELTNATPESNDTSQVAKIPKRNAIIKNINKILPSASELPPLVPVTNNNIGLSDSNLSTAIIPPMPSTNIPLPPLVPVSPLIKLKSAPGVLVSQTNSPLEKGRIYVANNLMEPTKRPIAVSATSGTSVRGRPFGSNQTRITKLKQSIGSSAEDFFSKCSVKGCAFRFKKPETVEYHRKCHDTASDNPQAMTCPECKSTEFNNWNTLHTHLWRAHQVDMELYKCELCEFKTPIFSRLVNTHAKIHFDDRNYKCEQCEKAFKNSKQLKNHRRWHRVQVTADSNVPSMPKATSSEIHRCSDCGSTFSLQKTLREHCCKKGDSSLKCSVCDKLISSKSSLKLHLLTHGDGEKRFKCQNCDYATNDHNAFRRHRMGHENRKMYECNFCAYKSVQSVPYQKHIIQKHPEKADSVIHKCSDCSFSTINRTLLVVHQGRHAQTARDKDKSKNGDEHFLSKATGNSVSLNVTELQKSKIKVKSNLFSTDISHSLINVNNNESNLVQLYNAECGSVT